MASKRHPPVDEVVLSVSFSRKDSLTGPRLGITIGSLLNEYPNIERQPPFEMPIEYPIGIQSAKGAGIRFEMLPGLSFPDPRFWLITQDGTRLLQVQPNFFALNWRKKDPSQEYPGYKYLRQNFTDLIRDVDSRVQAQEDGEIEPRQTELTYINILRSDELWRDYADTHRIVNMQINGLDEYEQVALTYTRSIKSPQDDFIGRLHVSVQPAVDASSGEAVLNLSITARSAPMTKASLDEVFGFLEIAHQKITSDFKSLISDTALDSWGLA